MPLFVECSRCGNEVSSHKALVLWVPETGDGWAYCRDCAEDFYENIEERLQAGDAADDHRCSECRESVSPRDVAIVSIDQDQRTGLITCRTCATEPVLPW